jgi:tripartite-type tricarboxylate transporter receptor subunit TctC
MPLHRHAAALALLAIAGGVSAQTASTSSGQAYPAKLIRVINPAAPGGNSDLLFRVLSPKMIELLGQQLVMEYRPGAGATVGTELLSKSAPDGYATMFVAASHVMNPAIVRKLPYDTLKDFTPLGLIADIPSALVTHPSLPAKNVKELITLGRAHPGAINYSSGGRGTVGHLAGTLFASAAKAQYTFVAYKGSHQALIDVMSGNVQFQFSSISNLLPYAASGRLRMLAQTGEKRSSSAANIPTMEEAGLPGFIVRSGFSFIGPAGMPRAVVEKLNSALVTSLREPANRKLLLTRGADPVGNTPEEHARYISTEIDKWMKAAREAGVVPE